MLTLVRHVKIKKVFDSNFSFHQINYQRFRLVFRLINQMEDSKTYKLP